MTDTSDPSRRPQAVRSGVLELLALVLVCSALVLLASAVLFAFAVDATRGGRTDLFTLLAQAGNPFVSLLVLAAVALVVRERAGRSGLAQRGGGAVIAIGTIVSLAAVLLALNGIVVDLTTQPTALLKLANAMSRIPTVLLSGAALWLALTAPRAPAGSPPGASGETSPDPAEPPGL